MRGWSAHTARHKPAPAKAVVLSATVREKHSTGFLLPRSHPATMIIVRSRITYYSSTKQATCQANDYLFISNLLPLVAASAIILVSRHDVIVPITHTWFPHHTLLVRTPKISDIIIRGPPYN